ncbi:FecR family protein [uncultured Proteiniphilum sp.]|uniref:FecR family protein n=1 Tax=uncultured Proteiniphilum sp. TaxID=497637 RepID=UPI0026377FBC|nr:FecR family protein [uncultured Proteiniphilum sp.]
MNKNSISKILKRFLSERFPDETEEKVQRWIIEDRNNEEKEHASFEYWNELKSEINPDTYSALERVNERIGYPQRKKNIPLYKKVSHIAAILIPVFLIAGGYFYYTSVKNILVEIHTAYGEEKHVFLPDSSEIWINAGTNLKYPKKFRDQRIVYLDGEAYFSVRKDQSKPFVVQTEDISVKVLGTQFNVKAYPEDERVITTLASGKVEIHTGTNNPRVLKPNEQLTYHKNTSKINITEISTDETDAWRNGQLIFSDASLPEILQVLERKFDVSISDNTTVPVSKLYTVKFLKNENLEEILGILQDIVGFSYRNQENKIILSKE